MQNQNINERMKYVRSFIKVPKLPKIDDGIWELVGVCLGDGCLSKYFSKYDNKIRYSVLFTGNSIDDYWYYQRYLVPLLRSKFNLKVNPHIRKNYNVIYTVIGSKRIFDFFKNLGMPVGKKKNKIKVTARMFRSSKNAKAAILRGLLDTDGCIFARKDEGYRYPHIKISNSNLKFLLQLKKLLKQFGLPAYVHWEGEHGGDVIIRGSKNVKNWMNFIGTSHPVHRRRYVEWLQSGKLLLKSHLANVNTNIGTYQNRDK